nr:MAG TPA: Helix-turn-helix of insertion element transposase [Caudoviricetes sp.]
MQKKDEKMARFPKNRVDLTLQVEYIYERIEPELIRQIAALDDEAIKLSVAAMVCELTKGVRVVPTKQHKVRFASALKAKGVKMRRVCELTGISKNTYYKLEGKDGR